MDTERIKVKVTESGAAGEPSSLKARGETRVFSDGRR